MTYSVKEMFYSLQGEGRHTGRPAVFCRFAGCNLWNGLERDRATAACNFCDTDFVGVDGEGGGKFQDAHSLTRAIEAMWAGPREDLFVVLTGGEPLLQVDEELLLALHQAGFEVALETNGSLPVPGAIDWITVSPKGQTPLKQAHGNELKLVYPQSDVDPASFDHLEFEHRYLQPMDGPDADANVAAAVSYCLQHPRWRLSLQTHKYMGIR
jgi:7-carboxy-7-deazaguanine synthase (Cx14CxxC type)